MHSSRPEAICVAVVDRDEDWVRRVAADLGEGIGARVTWFTAPELEQQINGHVPCHVLVIGRDSDPDLTWLHDLRNRYSDRELPIIVTDSEDDGDDHQIKATRAGANAFVDRTIHSDDNAFLEKLVYSLARE
jgi:CheY-like chemotaxis protein